MSPWLVAAFIGIVVLVAGVTMEGRPKPVVLPRTPASVSLAFLPRTLPQSTQSVLLGNNKTVLWQSSNSLRPETLQQADYLELRLPSGLSYVYPWWIPSVQAWRACGCGLETANPSWPCWSRTEDIFWMLMENSSKTGRRLYGSGVSDNSSLVRTKASMNLESSSIWLL